MFDERENVMFIKTEDGNLINTRFIYEIIVSEQFSDGTYGVIAGVQMSGTRILSRHTTKEDAEIEREKYFQMN